MDKEKINIKFNKPQNCELKEDMDISYEGNSVEVMYNPKFFIDTLTGKTLRKHIRRRQIDCDDPIKIF